MDLDALIARLRETIARYGLPIVLHLIYPDGRTELITLPTNNVPGNTPLLKAEHATRELSEREKAVMDVLAKATVPLKGQAIALRAHIRYNGRFRSMMAKLVEDELVIPGPSGGYWPADRPLPNELGE